MSSDLQLIQRENEGRGYEKPWTPRPIDVIAAVFFISYIGCGSLIYISVEDWSYWSSTYFCIITLSTVGYGDMKPESDSIKLFTILYVYIAFFFYATIIGSLIGRRTSDPLVNDDLPTKKTSSSWPEAPIDGGPLKPVQNLVSISQYREDLRRRGMAIVRVGVVIFLLAAIAVIFYSCNQGFTAGNAVYFTLITLCTVGYGDVKINKVSSRVFDTFFVLCGVPLMVYIVFLIGALFSKMMQQRMFRIFFDKGITMDVMRAVADSKTGKVQRSDFIAYLLVHRGKVKPVDIKKVNQLFNKIDVNRCEKLEVKKLRVYMKDKNILYF